jgi:UDPglucose 6-dehydrogenase
MVENHSKMLNISIFGAGYVGMSLAALLSQKHKINIFDIDESKVKKINKNQSTINDSLIEKYLIAAKHQVHASLPKSEEYKKSDLFIIATPTDYSEIKNSFDTSSVETVLENIFASNLEENALIIIKSTVPVGFTASMNKKFSTNRVVFSPEFLREGSALNDNLHPSRIIIGGSHSNIDAIVTLFNDSSESDKIPTFIMDSSSAEAVKLFSNTYLAMRVSFFNELDSFSIEKNLDPLMLINGICADPRIGNFYNNPSFGYGGYCLPKDTKQLLANYSNIPQNLIQAIVEANLTRKDYIANQILLKDHETIGIFRLAMKSGSDNYRFSSIESVMVKLIENKKTVIIFEPMIDADVYMGAKVFKDLSSFKAKSNLIIANRNCSDLNDVKEKVYTRDLFNTD